MRSCDKEAATWGHPLNMLTRAAAETPRRDKLLWTVVGGTGFLRQPHGHIRF